MKPTIKYTLIDYNGKRTLIEHKAEYEFTKLSIYFSTIENVYIMGIGKLNTRSDYNVSLNSNEDINLTIICLSQSVAEELIALTLEIKKATRRIESLLNDAM